MAYRATVYKTGLLHSLCKMKFMLLSQINCITTKKRVEKRRVQGTGYLTFGTGYQPNFLKVDICLAINLSNLKLWNKTKNVNNFMRSEKTASKFLFVAFCSFFLCSLTVFHRGGQQKSGGRQWKSSRADKQHCFPKG